MAVTYEPIASITLSAQGNNVTFSSIPSNMTDLVLVIVARNIVAATNDALAVRLNGDTTSLYSSTHLYGNGTSSSSIAYSNDGFIRWPGFAVSGASAASGVFGTTIIHFANYANTNVFKTLLTQYGVAGAGVGRGVGLYRSTAALTSIAVVGFSNDFASGSTFSLFGVRAA